MSTNCDNPGYSLEFSGCSNGYVGWDTDTIYTWLRGYELVPVEDADGGRGIVLFFKATPRAIRLHTYRDMQAAVRELAIEWQYCVSEWADMSYAEWAAWECLFRALGRRYGLMREFHENGIC